MNATMKAGTTTKMKAPYVKAADRAALDRAALEAEMDDMTPDQVRSRFARCCLQADKLILEAAMCVKVMWKRDRASVRGIPGYTRYLKIANGEILPEAVLAFQSSKNLPLIEKLPPSDQERLIKDPKILIAEPIHGGKGFTKRFVDINEAEPWQAKQVLSPDGIIPVEEQEAAITTRQTKAAIKTTVKRDEPDEPLEKEVTVRLTAREYKNLSMRAVAADVSPARYARTRLIESGALKPI